MFIVTHVVVSFCFNNTPTTYIYTFSLNIALFFFFNDTATTEIYTLSLHDALPIWLGSSPPSANVKASPGSETASSGKISPTLEATRDTISRHPSKSSTSCRRTPSPIRSEEHTSELQSHLNLVCRLLLDKKT